MEEKSATFLPVNYYSVVEELSEASSFKKKGHIQHHIAISLGDGEKEGREAKKDLISGSNCGHTCNTIHYERTKTSVEPTKADEHV